MKQDDYATDCVPVPEQNLPFNSAGDICRPQRSFDLFLEQRLALTAQDVALSGVSAYLSRCMHVLEG